MNISKKTIKYFSVFFSLPVLVGFYLFLISDNFNFAKNVSMVEDEKLNNNTKRYVSGPDCIEINEQGAEYLYPGCNGFY